MITKNLKYVLSVALLCLLLTGCKKEPNLFFAKITADIKSLNLKNGAELVVTDVHISDPYMQKGDDGDKVPVTEYEIARVEFFIANRMVGEDNTPPYTLNYTLADLPAGDHQFRVDMIVTHLPKRIDRDKRFQWGHRARVGSTYTLKVKE